MSSQNVILFLTQICHGCGFQHFQTWFSGCVNSIYPPSHTCLLGFVLMFQEEQEYVELVAAEKHQQEAVKSALAQNKTLSMLDEILEDVRKAADRLEEEIEEHAFDNNKQVGKH